MDTFVPGWLMDLYFPVAIFTITQVALGGLWYQMKREALRTSDEATRERLIAERRLNQANRTLAAAMAYRDEAARMQQVCAEQLDELNQLRTMNNLIHTGEWTELLPTNFQPPTPVNAVQRPSVQALVEAQTKTNQVIEIAANTDRFDFLRWLEIDRRGQ